MATTKAPFVREAVTLKGAPKPPPIYVPLADPGMMLALQQAAVCILPVAQSKENPIACSAAIASGAALKASARARYFSSGLVEKKRRSRGAAAHGLPATRRSRAGGGTRGKIFLPPPTFCIFFWFWLGPPSSVSGQPRALYPPAFLPLK